MKRNETGATDGAGAARLGREAAGNVERMRDALRALVEYWDWNGYDAMRESRLKEEARAALAEAEADDGQE